MGKSYLVPENPFEILDMLPDGPAWNYLHAVLEPESRSSEDLEAVVKITRGVAQIHPTTLKHLYQYPTSGENFLIGREGYRTTWEKIEITENEPFWIKQARTFFLNNHPFNEAAKIYTLKYLNFLRNAHRFEGDERPEFDLGITVWESAHSEYDGKMIVKIIENKKDEETETLIQTFDRHLKPIPGLI